MCNCSGAPDSVVSSVSASSAGLVPGLMPCVIVGVATGLGVMLRVNSAVGCVGPTPVYPVTV